MKAVIFCGGPGTRMWPISRKAAPKQLEKIFGTKSTAQLMLDRIKTILKLEDIYIATSREYQSIIEQSFPEIPKENIFYEPVVRDLGPAVGNAFFRLALEAPDEPVVILWSDSLIENTGLFRVMLEIAEKQNIANPGGIVYFGCRPTFPNQNLGWIELGEKVADDSDSDIEVYDFKNWTYRPPLKVAKKWFKEKTHVWNMGFFVATPSFIISAFKEYAPKLFSGLKEIQKVVNTGKEKGVLTRVYPTFEKISFDDAVVVHIPKEKVIVLAADLGWSDPGALDALKEALEKTSGDNVTKGKVAVREVEDCLLYNDSNGLLAAIGVKGLLIVVTRDVVLVCDKDKVPEIKKLVGSFKRTDLERYT